MHTTTKIKKYVQLLEDLKSEQEKLEARLAEIKAALGPGPTSTGGLNGSSGAATDRAATGPGRGGYTRDARVAAARRAARVQNAMSLREAVRKVTAVRPLTKPEILAAISKLGYKFAAKDPMNSLNVTLYTKGHFKNESGKFSPAS